MEDFYWNYLVFGQGSGVIQLQVTKKWICIFANLVAKLMQMSNFVIFVHFCTYAKLEICCIFAIIPNVKIPRLREFCTECKINAFLYICNDSKIKCKFVVKKKIAYVQKIVQN